MTTAGLLLAGLCCFAAAALASFVDRGRLAVAARPAYLVLAAGAIVVAVAGFRADLPGLRSSCPCCSP